MAANKRIFLREVSSGKYDTSSMLAEQRKVERVWRENIDYDESKAGYKDSDPSKESLTEWIMSPEDEPLRTQTLNVHFKELFPGGSNTGHGHQNEAAFYILEGRGYEIHDGERYDWEEGDWVFVHADSVHRHFNADPDNPAKALVVKAKSSYLALGLLQQGAIEPWTEEDDRYGPRRDWSVLWSEDAPKRKKVVKADDGDYELTPDGYVRTVASNERTDVRGYSVDIYMYEIPPGSRSSKHWHMADEYVHVLSGSGRTRQWDVVHELDDMYYARIANEPFEADFEAGDNVYVPVNTVHVFENTSETEPLRFISTQNRLIKQLGYDRVEVLEPAPEWVDR
jgi:quercetin dioxygenase-like cupin family protein